MEFTFLWIFSVSLIALSPLISASHKHKNNNSTQSIYDVTDYTFYYKSHHYEFNYEDLIQIPNKNILINNKNAIITTVNSSMLSYIINDVISLHFLDNTQFHHISYKYLTTTPGAGKRRLLLATGEPYKWLGCFRDTGNRALRYGPHRYGYTIQSCYETCKAQYKYFALQHRSWCCCDNDFAHATKYGKYDSCPANHHGGGWGNDIFQVQPRFPILQCPAQTTEIGKRGGLNDIGGCGLEGCDKRYAMNSIDECNANCMTNPNCKSFSWASKGGDKNHADKTVCTIYDNDVPNQEWGPNQIMCKIGTRAKCPIGTVAIDKQGGLNDIRGCGLGGCEKRYTISNVVACKASCESNPNCKSFSWAPKGGDKNHADKTVCTIYDNDVPDQEWGPHQIMCKIGMRCPTGTQKIGEQGAMNDIGGCGLDGCDKRYTIDTVQQCNANCVANHDCKSFSWAPIGGDKNHADNTVCTIYDRDVANQQWGPNQIMCGIGSAAHLARLKEKQEEAMQQQQKRMGELKNQQQEHYKSMKQEHEKGLNEIKKKQEQHRKQLTNKLAAMQKQRAKQLNKAMRTHRKTMSKHMTGMKSALLAEMKNSFKNNNKQTMLLQQINGLKHQQSDLEIQHKMLEGSKKQRAELEKQTNNIMQKQVNWEQQRKIARQKRMQQREKLMQQQHQMKLDEQYQLMNGLKGFLMAFKNLYKTAKEPAPKPQKPQIPALKPGPGGGGMLTKPGVDGRGYETRWTKFAHFNRRPPLLPPIPPLPPGMQSAAEGLIRGISGRRRLMDENTHFVEISKCKFDAAFGELCMRYNERNDIISFDIVIPQRKELKLEMEGNKNINSRDMIDTNKDTINDIFVANLGFNVWKYELMDYKHFKNKNLNNEVIKYGQYAMFDDYIHHFVVYKYEFILDEIFENFECGHGNGTGTLSLPFCVCLKMDINQLQVIIYFDRVDKFEMFGNDKLTNYMQKFETFEFNWMDNDKWDEIISFSHDNQGNHLRKCANLAITKLCVDNEGDNSYAVEVKLQFFNQML